MLVEIEAKCGQYNLCKKLCPFEHYGFQWEEDFCNKGKAYTEKCNYCMGYSNDHPFTGSHMCNNYFLCSLADEVMDYHKNGTPFKTRGGYNMNIDFELKKAHRDWNVNKSGFACKMTSDIPHYYVTIVNKTI